jgi:ribosomal protein S4
LSKFDLSSDFDDNFYTYKNSLLRLVYLKKKYGFFKKDSKINHYFLYKVNFLKNTSNNKYDYLTNDLDSKPLNKFFDFKSSSFSTFYKNRKIFKNLILLKNIKQKKTTKILSKLIKSNFLKFVNFFEFSLLNILIKSKICYTRSESIFLIKNDFVFINGVSVNNPFVLVKKSDIIQISLSDLFFDFFKINTDKKYKTICLLKHII